MPHSVLCSTNKSFTNKEVHRHRRSLTEHWLREGEPRIYCQGGVIRALLCMYCTIKHIVSAYLKPNTLWSQSDTEVPCRLLLIIIA